MVSTICPSPPMRTNAFGAKPSASAAGAARLSPGKLRLSSSPPPTAAPVFMNVLRESPPSSCWSTASSGLEANRSWNMSASLDGRQGGLRRLFDCFANADISPTPTDIAGHRIVDVGIARVRITRQQRGCGHDLAGATLNDFEIEPRLLNLLARRRIPDSFDRGDRRAANAIDRRDTGAGRRSVQMNRAGTAKCHPATELGAGHAEHVTKYPQ